MEGLKLGVREQQYYGELFQACDTEGNGKITGPKASELFLASGLSPDILKQITELCGAKRLGHFGRSQFYIALKLVALAQAGLPLKFDALNPGKDLPLPKFSSKGNDAALTLADRKKSSGEPDSAATDVSGKANAHLSGQLPPPPVSKKSHSRSLSGQYRGVVPDTATVVSSQSGQLASSQRDNSPHNSKSPPFSPDQSPPTSPVNQKVLLKQNTAPAMVFANSGTNISSGAQMTPQSQVVMSSSLDGAEATRQLVHPAPPVSDVGHVNPVALSEGSGVSRGPVSGGVNVQAGPGPIRHQQQQQQQQHPPGQENGNWTMFDDDENHMLIGSGVKQQYSSLEPPNFDSSSISSEAESVDDVWTITDEQREYYVNQFKTMQPDLTAVITGPVAKHFFEKSKLPVVELSKIWQLSDLNCDGALSLEEFCIAMHLVVLRRNDIELPDHLPVSLMPYSTLTNDEPFAVDLPPGSTLKRATPPSPQQPVAQWTTFVSESPESSGVPSPAHLANFEFAKPSADPEQKIVQPVPLHMLPDGLPAQSEGFDRGRAFSDSAVPYDSGEGLEAGEITPPLTKQRAHTESSQSETPNKYNTPVHGRPRPIPPKKNSSVPAVLRGQLQPPPGSGVEGSSSGAAAHERTGDVAGGQPQAPPTPPPRPLTNRSMSVDVKSTGPQLVAPAVPPRISPNQVPVSHKVGEAGVTSALEPRPVAAHRVLPQVPTHRRSVSLGVVKLGTVTSAAPVPPPDLPQDPPVMTVSQEKERLEDEDGDASAKERLQPKPNLVLRQGSRDRRDIHMAVRTHKERNTMLTRLNSELNQELQEVMEQRIALEIQLEHLRPFSS